MDRVIFISPMVFYQKCVYYLPMRCQDNVFVALLTVLNAVPHEAPTNWIDTGGWFV